MKQFLPILLVLFCYACSDHTAQEIPYTIIKGKITNTPLSKRVKGEDRAEVLQKRREIQLVSNAIRSDLDAPNHHAITDEEGNYKFLIKIEKPTEVRLQYGRPINLPLYLEPGDEIIIDIDYLDTTLPQNQPYRIKGDHAIINQQMANYDQLFNDSFKVELRATLPFVIPREFKEQRAKITQRIRRLTEQFSTKNASNNPTLAAWIKHHSEYRIAMDYMKYAFKTYRFNDFSLSLKEGFPLEFFDFWEEFPVNNPAAITSLNYQNYVQLFRKYLMSKLRQTTPFQDCLNFPDCNYFDLEIAELKNHLEGKTFDLVLSQQIDNHLVRNNQRFLEKGFVQYLAALNDSLLIQQIQARKNYLYQDRSFDYPANATFYQSDGTGEQVLQQITQVHKERSTLLYFWNSHTEVTWPFSQKSERQKIWKVLDTLNFDLVLLAHHSTTNEWKECIIDKGLIQDQWHLTDKQYQFFENHFQTERKKHIFYDKIRDYENFILALDQEGNLVAPEIHFSTLNSIAYQMKWQATRKEKLKVFNLQ